MTMIVFVMVIIQKQINSVILLVLIFYLGVRAITHLYLLMINHILRNLIKQMQLIALNVQTNIFKYNQIANHVQIQVAIYVAIHQISMRLI